jgi:phage gpG-like protein
MAKLSLELRSLVMTKVRPDWFKRLADQRLLVELVKDFIKKGLSPVKGFGRFKQYSKSYVDTIMGRIRFFTFRGRVVPILPSVKVYKKGKKGEHSKVGKDGKPIREKFEKGLGIGKKRSPVNMTQSGEMLDSLTFEHTKEKALLGFKDKKAYYHNDTGPGGRKQYMRRLLPTKSGERFDRRIEQKMNEQLRRSMVSTLQKEKKKLNILIKLTKK